VTSIASDEKSFVNESFLGKVVATKTITNALDQQLSKQISNNNLVLQLYIKDYYSATSEMTYIVLGGALNSTHSLTQFNFIGSRNILFSIITIYYAIRQP